MGRLNNESEIGWGLDYHGVSYQLTVNDNAMILFFCLKELN